MNSADDTSLRREHQRRLARWVAVAVFPHEPKVRAWLRRRKLGREEIDEIVQDGYCSLAALSSTDHILRPDAYFFSIVRNLAIRRLKQEPVVSIEQIAEIEAYAEDRPGPEQEAAGRDDMARLLSLMARLPDRCRNIVRLRKIEGWSQKQIAAEFGMTEKAVEKQIWRGVRALRAAWTSDDDRMAATMEQSDSPRKVL